MAVIDPFDLGWHADYIFLFAQDRALVAFLEIQGQPSADIPTVFERAGQDLAADVAEPMAGIKEDPELIRRAQLAALETFRRHLRLLVATCPDGGRA